MEKVKTEQLSDEALLNLVEDLIIEKLTDEKNLKEKSEFYQGRISAFDFIHQVICERRELPF